MAAAPECRPWGVATPAARGTCRARDEVPAPIFPTSSLHIPGQKGGQWKGTRNPLSKAVFRSSRTKTKCGTPRLCTFCSHVTSICPLQRPPVTCPVWLWLCNTPRLCRRSLRRRSSADQPSCESLTEPSRPERCTRDVFVESLVRNGGRLPPRAASPWHHGGSHARSPGFGQHGLRKAPLLAGHAVPLPLRCLLRGVRRRSRRKGGCWDRSRGRSAVPLSPHRREAVTSLPAKRGSPQPGSRAAGAPEDAPIQRTRISTRLSSWF